MTELTLANLDALIQKAERLKELLQNTPEIIQYLQLADNLQGAIMPIPTDRLIRTGEAAKVLNVSKATISYYARTGILTPLYTAGSTHKKFWLSEVKAVAKRLE